MKGEAGTSMTGGSEVSLFAGCFVSPLSFFDFDALFFFFFFGDFADFFFGDLGDGKGGRQLSSPFEILPFVAGEEFKGMSLIVSSFLPLGDLGGWLFVDSVEIATFSF